MKIKSPDGKYTLVRPSDKVPVECQTRTELIQMIGQAAIKLGSDTYDANNTYATCTYTYTTAWAFSLVWATVFSTLGLIVCWITSSDWWIAIQIASVVWALCLLFGQHLHLRDSKRAKIYNESDKFYHVKIVTSKSNNQIKSSIKKDK